MADRKALVTGASEGIGRAFAVRLAKEGYKITAVARSEDRLQELVKELGAGHRYLVADLCDAKGVDTVASDVAGGGYDLLVNNAGIGAFGTFDQVAVDRQIRTIQLNCEAVVRLAHAFLQKAKQGDALINVSSTLGLNGFPYSSVYAATKAFVLSFSESLWFEMKERDVYVMALCPGVTSSNFHEAAGGRADNRPPQGITQTPADVAEEALRALKARRTPTVVSGAKNRMMGFMTKRFMTRKRAISLMGSFASELKSP